jgi:hypothetical protein
VQLRKSPVHFTHGPLAIYCCAVEANLFETATAKYLDAYNKLEAEDASAIAAFAIVVASRPNDALAEFHLRRLLNGAKGVRIDVGP